MEHSADTHCGQGQAWGGLGRPDSSAQWGPWRFRRRGSLPFLVDVTGHLRASVWDRGVGRCLQGTAPGRRGRKTPSTCYSF